jgi:UPF0755 protein
MFIRLKKLFTAVIFVLLIVLAAGSFVFWKVSAPVALPAAQVDFNIAAGSSLRASAYAIADAGVPVEPWLLIALGKALRVEASIKAGSYEVGNGITLWELMKKLSRGDVQQTEIAFIEGWTFRQMRDRLDAHADVRHLTKGLPDAEVMRLLGLDGRHPEGLFFPETYFFVKQSRDLDILARAHRTMRERLAAQWELRAPGLPYADAYQALIMASIVEKETGREQDRPLVAAVFVNRLRQGMLLQTDPTVIYGMGDRFDGNLRKRDLTADTPYNTYTRAGLPPTPIAMPGQASLVAALHPANSDAIYFVARGDGTSQFSRTLIEHNQAVNRYQRGGK